jgi:hypothetical protein
MLIHKLKVIIFVGYPVEVVAYSRLRQQEAVLGARIMLRIDYINMHLCLGDGVCAIIWMVTETSSWILIIHVQFIFNIIISSLLGILYIF